MSGNFYYQVEEKDYVFCLLVCISQLTTTVFILKSVDSNIVVFITVLCNFKYLYFIVPFQIKRWEKDWLIYTQAVFIQTLFS